MAKPPPRKRPAASSRDQTRTLLMIAALVAVVAVVGVVVALVIGGTGDDDDDDDDAAPAAEIYHPVDVSGDGLPAFTEEVKNSGDDPAIGEEAPVVSGLDYNGDATTIDASTDGPTMVVLLAHWCPHCNAEVPRLNEWRDDGDVPEGLNVVGVSTAVRPNSPNYPPNEWIADVDWQWPVLADDERGTAFEAYGGVGFPTMVIIGSEGQVLARFSGEFSVEQIDEMVDDALATDSA